MMQEWISQFLVLVTWCKRWDSDQPGIVLVWRMNGACLLASMNVSHAQQFDSFATTVRNPFCGWILSKVHQSQRMRRLIYNMVSILVFKVASRNFIYTDCLLKNERSVYWRVINSDERALCYTELSVLIWMKRKCWCCNSLTNKWFLFIRHQFICFVNSWVQARAMQFWPVWLSVLHENFGPHES